MSPLYLSIGELVIATPGSDRVEKETWQKFILIGWHFFRPGLHFSVEPVYYVHQFKRSLLNERARAKISYDKVESLNEWPSIGSHVYFRSCYSWYIWHGRLIWTGTREECLNYLQKYERWIINHRLPLEKDLYCIFKPTKRELDYTDDLIVYGNLSRVIDMDFDRSIQAMNPPDAKRIKMS